MKKMVDHGLRYCLSITGRDRPGIVAAVSKVLFDHRGNLEDASMTILAGEFAMILFVFFQEKLDQGALDRQLSRLEREKGLRVTIYPSRHRPRRHTREYRKGRPFLLSVFGKDRAGIVYRVSDLLARMNVNITDLNSKIITSRERDIYVLLIEVDIPEGLKINLVEKRLNAAAKLLGVDIALKPVDELTF